jgi:hypothetical protein
MQGVETPESHSRCTAMVGLASFVVSRFAVMERSRTGHPDECRERARR